MASRLTSQLGKQTSKVLSAQPEKKVNCIFRVIIMNSKVYKWCAVPLCKNTSISTPKKVFVHVPYKKTIRHKWLKLARRNPYDLVTNSPLYFCEDHFDLPNDMINYMEYHVMGSVSQVRMKPGCMPKTFTCQPDWMPGISDTTERPYIAKKRKIMILEETEKKLEEKVIEESNLEESVNSKPSSPNANVLCKIAKIEHAGSDTSYTPSVTDTETSVSVKIERLNDPFEMEPSSYCSEMEKDDSNKEDLNSLECTLKKIKNSPYFYIGIPSSCYYLVSLIQERTKIPFNHILLCLKKIRVNNSFLELANDFGIDRTDPSKIFLKNVPIIASVMRPFIVTLNEKIIENQLPIAFRHRFNKVTCIIDCLEIEVQKPSKVQNEALTWSENKKANTIKYLISCTPDGLINYISSGYGGRITDTSIVETSDFSKCFQPNMWAMADRGFKHIDVYLEKMGVLLVRPQNVESPAKLSKSEAKENKQIASLRIHVEQVIGRLREFNMLKPHACLDSSLVKILDDVVTIACALINIQDSLIM